MIAKKSSLKSCAKVFANGYQSIYEAKMDICAKVKKGDVVAVQSSLRKLDAFLQGKSRNSEKAFINVLNSDINGRTLLGEAIHNKGNAVAIINLLVSKGADINAPCDKRGYAVLDIAMSMHDEITGRRLISMGAKKRETTVLVAADRGRDHMLRVLKENPKHYDDRARLRGHLHFAA